MSKSVSKPSGPSSRSSGLLADWKVHTYRLLSEIANCSGNAIYKIPLNIFGKLLAKVGERAIELDDPQLNALMCRLTIYTAADPESPDYDPELVSQTLESANAPAHRPARQKPERN